MPEIISWEEFSRQREKIRKAIRLTKFSKTAKPRSAEKSALIIRRNIESMKEKCPRPCRDGFWRFPKDIEVEYARGNLDKIPEGYEPKK